MSRSIVASAWITALLSACQPHAETTAADAPAVTEPAVSSAPSATTDPSATDTGAAAIDAAAPTATIPDAAGTSEADVDKAIDDALGDHATYRKVMEDFQKAVAAKDASATAALVHYPVVVEIAGKNTVLKDAAAFVEDYDKFMTPEIVKAITDTRYTDVMVNYKGVMLGQGEAWINSICKDNACRNVDVKVITIQPKSDLSP